MVGPGRASGLSEAALARAFAYIAARPQIWEVILTGGDPLILAPRRLAEVGARLADLSHVRILRVHTRVPIAAPERIDRPLIAALRAAQKTLYVAIHANHPREITDDVKAACARLTEAGISLVSQTVLLRGVNDRVETLEALMRAFVEAGIKPYYLHHPDLAPGTSHLRITLDEGQALMRQLAARVSGLCQPRYVLDIPGGFGKVAVGPNYLQPIEAGTYTLRDHAGRTHLYPPRNEEA
jgi:lysine 2,3-aminomutase